MHNALPVRDEEIPASNTVPVIVRSTATTMVDPAAAAAAAAPAEAGDDAFTDASRRPFHPAEYSAAVDPVALITTECIAVTSAMRKHARWAHSSVSAILGGGASTGRSNDSPQQADPSERPGLGSRNWSRDILSGGDQRADGTGVINRWGLRGKKGKSIQDNPLIYAFLQLRSDLSTCTGTV